MKRFICRSLLAIILVVIGFESVAAQTFMFKSIPGESPKIGLRYLRPDFKDDFDLSTSSGIYEVRINLPVNDKWSLDASLPYTRYAFGEQGETSSYIGNIYTGIQYIRKTGNKSAIVSFGAFLPTAEDDYGHMLIGMAANIEDMFKYSHEAWTLYGNFAYFNIKKDGTRLGLEIGPDLLVSTRNSGDEPEFYMHYGLTAGYQGEKFAALTELIGLWKIGGESYDFSDRFMHSINIGLSYVSPRFMPGVFYKIYLEDLNDYVDGVLGINLEVTL